jgi:hypothetical protein
VKSGVIHPPTGGSTVYRSQARFPVQCGTNKEEDMQVQEHLSVAMDDFELATDACRELDDVGFIIVPGPVPTRKLGRLRAAYDSAITDAAPEDVKVASSTTRVRDFVNRGPDFDGLYLHPPILKACCRIINEPFRLSTMHARTLRPDLPAQNLHVDF